MAAASETYIDPSLDGDVGDGTEGDPYGDVRYGLGNFTFDGTNGHIVYVKAGTTENDADIPINCTPATTARLNFRKWGTGNNPKFNGMGGAVPIFDFWGGANHQKQNVTFEDMAFFNVSGGQYLIEAYGQMGFFRCEFYIASSGLSLGGTLGEVSQCYFHNITGTGCTGAYLTHRCFFKNEANKFVDALRPHDVGTASRNILLLDGATRGINGGNQSFVEHNSVLGVAGTGSGIYIASNGNRRVLLSNISEGFSGTGGYGYYGWAYDNYRWEKNAAYNNTIDYSVADRLVIGSLDDPDDNENLSESGFAKAGTLVSAPLDFNDPGFWAQVYEYFAPVDTGNVLAGAFPGDVSLSKGAVQAAGGGGGTPVCPGRAWIG